MMKLFVKCIDLYSSHINSMCMRINTDIEVVIESCALLINLNVDNAAC